MTAELVNLRQARKRKRRDEAAKGADANRLQFGRSRSEKAEMRLKREIEEKKLQAHRRESHPEPPQEPDHRQDG